MSKNGIFVYKLRSLGTQINMAIPSSCLMLTDMFVMFTSSCWPWTSLRQHQPLQFCKCNYIKIKLFTYKMRDRSGVGFYAVCLLTHITHIALKETGICFTYRVKLIMFLKKMLEKRIHMLLFCVNIFIEGPFLKGI